MRSALPGTITVTIYVVICVLLTVGAILENDPVAFAPLFFVTLPFSYLVSQFFTWMGWSPSAFTGTTILLISAALNAVIIFLLTQLIARALCAAFKK